MTSLRNATQLPRQSQRYADPFVFLSHPVSCSAVSLSGVPPLVLEDRHTGHRGAPCQGLDQCELGVMELGVAASSGEEFVVGTALDDSALFDHQDLVRGADGG
jgi:hypothetical protein